MCNMRCLTFGVNNMSRDEIKGKRIVDIGSCDVNGSLRPIFESWHPSEYIGVDIREGPNVDVMCNAENLVEKFGQEQFDVVIRKYRNGNL